MMEAGAKGIIIECVNPDTSAAIADAAKEKGAAVFACAITLNSDSVFASGLNDCYDLGESTGKYAKEYFDENFSKNETINMAIISYDEQDMTGSDARIQGFPNQLSDYDIHIVGRQDGQVADKAYTVVFAVDCSEQLVEIMKSDKNILQGTTAQAPYTLGTYAVKTVYDYVVNGVEPAEKDFHADCIQLTRKDLAKVDEWLAIKNENATK